MFGSESSINNLIKNITKFLRKDGYIILTLFDSELVDKAMDDDNKYTSYYTNEDGKREVLYEIVKNQELDHLLMEYSNINEERIKLQQNNIELNNTLKMIENII